MKVIMLSRKNVYLGIALSVAVLVIVCGYAYERGWMSFLSGGESQRLERYADEVIDICSKDSYPPRCYDIEIPKLMDRGLAMEDAFQVTSIIQGRVGDYFYCHVLGHNLSAKETAKDPSKWTEVVARCPVGMCSNGCLHGAAQERFRDDVLSSDQIQALVPELGAICEPDEAGRRDFTGLEQASCYHSLGHLTMYISGAEIELATSICDQIAKKPDGRDFSQTCYEGAYMQIFQPLEPEDFALVAHIPAKTIPEAETFCDQFSGEQRSACHRESWPLYRETFEDPGALERFCTLVPDGFSVQRCYNAMFYVLTAQFNFDQARIVGLCDMLPEKRKAQCYGNSASRFLETDYRLTDRAIALCNVADEKGLGDRCWKELTFYAAYNFHVGSDPFTYLCNALPDPYKEMCLSGQGMNIRPSQGDL